jgi:uncharacterized protein YeaO (DUF488 family)
MIRTKRIYEKAAKTDGKRFLVDRLWPRGISREVAQLEGWVSEAAQAGDVTFLFGAKDEQYNNALALREFMVAKLRGK